MPRGLPFEEIVKAIAFHVDTDKARNIAVSLQQEGVLLVAANVLPQNKIDPEKIQIYLDICSSELSKLSEWETGFIESVADQFLRNGTLSEKQINRLKEIYDKVA